MNNSQHISSLLLDKKSPISSLYKKAISFKKVDAKLKKYLDLGIQDHFQLSNINNDIATIVVDSSSWATRLRYNIPAILNIMNNQLNFTAIKTIRIRVKNNL